MPRTPEQFRAMREESRERILDAALALFARRGYAGTSVRMIAEEVGISQGLIYNYFDGKQDVLRAVFERSMEDVAESFERAVEGGTPAERLGGLVRSALEIVERNLSFWRLTYQLRTQPEVVEGMAAEQRRRAEAIRGRIEALVGDLGLEPVEANARALFAAIDGAAQHYALEPEDYPVAAVAGAIVARFEPRRDRGASPRRMEDER